jgi:hypothetical protein
VRYASCVTHEEARLLLRSYAAGELGLEEAAPVRAHLATGCAVCLRDVFNHPLVPAPPPLEAPAPRRGRRSTLTRAAVAASLAAGGIAAWGVRHLHAPEARPVGELPGVVEWAPPPTDQAKFSRDLEAAHRTERPHPSVRAPGRVERMVPTDRAAEVRDAPIDVRPPAPLVQYARDVVSVRVFDLTLAEVLDEIGRQSGAAIRGQVSETRRVTADFAGVPLPEALHRLLGDQNFLLVYDAQKQPRAVELLSLPSEVVPARADGSPSRMDGSPSLEGTLRLLDRYPQVLLKAELAEALGTQAMPLRQLLDTSLNHAEKTVRAEATRSLLAAIEADDELRSALLAALPPKNDTALSALVRGMAGDRAEEALFYLATQAWGSGLRNMAVSLLQQPPGGEARRPPSPDG